MTYPSLSPRTKAIYAAVVVFATIVAGFVGSIAYTNHVDSRREASDRANAAAQRKAAEQAHASVCALVNANVAVYDETPPTSPAGKNLAESWRRLHDLFAC